MCLWTNLCFSGFYWHIGILIGRYKLLGIERQINLRSDTEQNLLYYFESSMHNLFYLAYMILNSLDIIWVFERSLASAWLLWPKFVSRYWQCLVIFWVSVMLVGNRCVVFLPTKVLSIEKSLKTCFCSAMDVALRFILKAAGSGSLVFVCFTQNISAFITWFLNTEWLFIWVVSFSKSL